MSESWVTELDHAVDRLFAEVVELREHLHAHPELSGEENDTSLHLYQRLAEHGLQVRIGPEGQGVIADLNWSGNGSKSPCIAIRADIDALPIQDQTDRPYRSQNPGVMHACGHDAHAAIATGTLAVLAELSQAQQIPWPISTRGIFQPAEETCQGAIRMIDAGCLDGVQAILSLHVDPSRDVGRIGFRNGVMTAHCDDVRLRITGQGGHAARPHEAADPVAVCAQLISSLYMFVPRATDSLDAVVLSIGRIRGADVANAIPEWVELRGTLRTLDLVVRAKAIEHIRQLAEGIGQASGTQIEIEVGVGSGSIHNDAQLVEIVRQSGVDVLGEGSLDTIERPSMGSEDFAYYLEHVPGAMFRLGSASAAVGNAPLHSPTFDVDRESLRIGVRFMARSVIQWCNPDRQNGFRGKSKMRGAECEN